MRELRALSAALEPSKSLGHRITRRLSQVAYAPSLFMMQSRLARNDNEFAATATTAGYARRWPHPLRRSRPIAITIVLPNGVERTVSLFITFLAIIL